MPYLGKTVTGEAVKAEATSRPPFGPGFSEEKAAEADKLEIWHSSFTDPGEDFTEFVLYKNNEQIDSAMVGGY
jgi:hypothetical protein